MPNVQYITGVEPRDSKIGTRHEQAAVVRFWMAAGMAGLQG
jgi:hypothetical protein